MHERQAAFAELMAMLADGWTVEPPVYRMASAFDRKATVYRMVLWREGRPHVATVRDGPDIRRFVADHSLKQESL